MTDQQRLELAERQLFYNSQLIEYLMRDLAAQQETIQQLENENEDRQSLSNLEKV